MKVLLFNLNTGDYLQPTTRWEPGRETALTFPTAEDALSYAVKRRFEGVVVHLYFGADGRDIFLPVSLPKN